MGLFDEIAKGALDGVVGAKTAEFISQKLAESDNPTISHLRNKVDEKFAQTTKNLRQNHPQFAEKCDKAVGLLTGYSNHMTGNAFASQPEQEPGQQVVSPIQQLRSDDPGSASGDKSMWDFE
ncbi:MAG: hypothetical protein J6O71_01650 [Lachnospiraceae bacterium]|nr:hypothetical protein [Lachnospiraceae bacterium]